MATQGSDGGRVCESRRIEVFDIINAGPRHRFAYNGVIVSNCRVLDYLAGDTKGLDEFRRVVCPYSSMALSVWPTEGVDADAVKRLAKAGDEVWAPRRQIGKTIVLGAGFGSGGLGFKLFAETTAGVKMTLEEATEYITKYRASKPKIPAFWRRCGRVLQALVDGQSGEFGGLDGKLFQFDGARRVLGVSMPGIRLPNGLWLSYPGLAMHHEERINQEGEPEMRKVFTFKTKKGRAVETVYTHGAVIAENCVAGDAEVLTDRGWRRLDTITTERVHDGIEFVEHEGLIHKGMQRVVTIDGVDMTPDHEVLTHDGWKQAHEILLQSRVADGATAGTAGALVVGGPERAVFDLRNCGPRHRFVVRGEHGPFIVHNCTQATAFAIMKWQARAPVIAENGLALNTHDEHVITVPAEQAEAARDAMVAAMRTAPPWMPGLPLGTDDGIGASYGEC